MSNLIRRNEGGVARTWEPLRMARDLMGWDPFAEMMPSLTAPLPAFAPTFEVKETKDAYVFHADLPGVKEDDLEVTVTGNRLVVGGKREAEERHEDERFYAYERSYGTFSRAFTLPDGIDSDHVEAKLADGVLTVRVAKAPELQPRKIPLVKRLGEKLEGVLAKGDKANA